MVKMSSCDVIAITMVRNELFFLEKWIEYYGSQLGAENLYVLLHGNAPDFRAIDERVNFVNIPVRKDDTVGHSRFNQDRFSLINAFANELNRYFDWVIVTDVDEFVVVDPKLGLSLPEYLSEQRGVSVLSAVGLDVVHRTETEVNPLDLDQKILAQRMHCKFEPLYSKPAVSSKPIRRGLGNHYSNEPRLTFGEDLYLFHLKYMDQGFSLGMHESRDKSFHNKIPDFSRTLVASDDDFRWKNDLLDRFRNINELEVVSGFDFANEKARCHKTWRRRRYALQKEFWRALASRRLKEFSFHWRFDLTRDDRLYRIPELLRP